jgi:hypothetical protein
VGVTTASVAALVATAGPAIASGAPAANHLLIGSGSATTYNLMQGMDTLYNDSPGCNLITISSVPQPLDFSCPSASNTTSPPNVSATFGPYPDFATSSGYTENPGNDVSTQEPPLGSSNGIKGLESQTGTSSCNSSVPAAPLDFARSSRALSATDCQGLNFVAYAVDGVSFFYYPKVGGFTTPSGANVNTSTGLSTQLLIDAWNGTLQCWNDPVVAAGFGTPSYTYATAGCEPIILYTAQAGSGTLSTWNGFLGENSETYLDTLNGKKFTYQNKTGGTSTETYSSNKHVILENEDRELVANKDEANALFFFSWGKFQVTCAKNKCGKGITGTTTEALGNINGIAPTTNTILCGAGVGGTGCGAGTDFAPTRFIYNVYSDGSNPKVPESSVAAINYVSELGFICKPQTMDGSQNGTAIVDPITGTKVRSEVSSVIKAAGFIPMPWQASEGSVPNPAYSLLKAAASTNHFDGEVSSVDTVGQSASNEAGYCLVTTTDNNSSQ